MTGPIGRISATGNVAPVRDGERPAERDGGRVGTRGRDGARGAADVTDRVTISPAALRGLPGGGGDEGAELSGGGTPARLSAAPGGRRWRRRVAPAARRFP